ncbi:MAG: immunoglobulin domain-containing protein, partial [Pirellulales bacterium]|nr:immunoglobulin domain-containing protein [Pirellulales bacterium]
GQLNLSTQTGQSSWLRSKAAAAPVAGQSLVLQMRAYAYAEGTSPGIVYGDKQPRGLRVGGDANNAIEFYSASRTSLGLRVRRDGVESLLTHSVPSGVDAMHDYEIVVTATAVTFKLDGVALGTITTNIPTGPLNVFVSTDDGGGVGNVPVTIESVRLTLYAELPAVAPAFATQPLAQTVLAGLNATFTVSATGAPPPTFQWQRSTDGGIAWSDLANGWPVSGATDATLAVAAVTTAESGQFYRCVATNSAGPVTSSVAVLRVLPTATAFNGTDDFATAAGWSAPSAATTGGRLVFSGGRLDYTVAAPTADDMALREWTACLGSYTQDWAVQVDVHLASLSLTGDQYANLNLVVCKSADALKPFGQMNAIDVAIDRYANGAATVHNFGGNLGGNGNRTPASGTIQVVNASTDATLRVSFNATTKVLSSWFDADGAANGYSWTLVQAVDIGSGTYTWGMDASSTFAVSLVGGSGGVALSSGQAWFDNLVATGAGQLIAYDSFQGYAAGELNGQGRGFGWTGNWSASTLGIVSAVPTGDLTVAGLAGATGLAQVGSLRGMGVYRNFPPVSSGTLYFGALVQYQDANSGIRLVALNGDDTANNSGSVILGQYYGPNGNAAETTQQFLTLRPYTGYSVATQIGVNTNLPVTTQTAYLVAKVVFNTNGAADSVWFWVNPAGPADLQNTANFQAASPNAFDLGNLGKFSAYVDDDSGFLFDEVRISTNAAHLFGALDVPVAPAISVQPQSQSVAVGANVTLSVVASGNPAPTYQWKKDGVDFPGATLATIVLANVQTTAAGSYTVVVSNGVGNPVASAAAVLTVTAAGPANDLFANAVLLSGTSATGSSDTTSATREAGEPSQSAVAGPSVWWKWVAPAHLTVTVDTIGSGYDTTLAIYRGPALAELVTVAWNDDIIPSTASRATFAAVSGTTYYIQVYGWNSGNRGPVALNLASEPGPANDYWVNAAAIATASAAITADNTWATREPGEPAHLHSTYLTEGNRSLWWKWTAPGAGNVALDTAGSAYDTVLTVYTGTAVDALTLAAGNNDATGVVTSALSFAAVGGTTYYFKVDGYEANLAGVTKLNFTYTASQAPVITLQPQAQVVAAGGNVTLSVTATGTPPLGYVWKKGETPLSDGGTVSGSSTSALTLANVQFGDAGPYVCVVTSGTASVTSEPAVLTVTAPQGLLGWWMGDYSTADATGRNDAGTMQAGASYGAGRLGQAFWFDGVDDWVNLGGQTGDFGTADFTVALWARFNELAREQILIEDYVETEAPGRTGWSIELSANGQVRFGYHGGMQLASSAVTAGSWHHVAVTRAGGTFTLFVNGVAQGSLSENVTLTSTATLKLGHRGNPTDTPGSWPSCSAQEFGKGTEMTERPDWPGTNQDHAVIHATSKHRSTAGGRPRRRALAVRLCGVLAAVLVATAPLRLSGEETVGQRPYEMVWANRIDDAHPALLDFENLDGWTVECVDSEASFTRSREQQIWGQYVGKLVYRGTGRRPSLLVKPPHAVALPQPFDCVNFWVYGNNWAWVSDKTTPQVEIAVLLRSPATPTIRLVMGRVRWKEWWVMHAKLSPEQAALLKEGALLEAIEVSGGRNTEDRTLYFDNLSVYEEALAPLKFQPRPQRNLTLFPGQSPGTNTGPGGLPFPTREETILPDNLTDKFVVRLEEKEGGYLLHYTGDDGHLVYRYQPATGTLGDITALWDGLGTPFRPMADGGLYFAVDEGGKVVAPDKIELVSCRLQDGAIASAWKCTVGNREILAKYTFRLWQKSLVVDVECLGGEVGEFRVGRAAGVENPRLVTLPYLACESQRPAVMVLGPVEMPLFVFSMMDYYRSNASSLWAANQVTEEGVTYNGGSRYLQKTDGKRNDCFERLFLTVSPRFEEVLPNVANPKSPWMHVAGERVWIAYGASDRAQNYAFWKNVARYGMTNVVITDHETGWRDGGESFTMRTRAAPGKGGDAGQAEYARKIRALGFRYGIYNNYTDFAPVNEHWDEDYVTRTPHGDWQTAWARCYNPKPSRAVELEANLAPIIQEKFQLDTAYCDVHTAVQPWRYCDFDARVPGAGTFAATLYAYGEIMLHQKKTWNGPVYSEGNNHWYYCGLSDGNYGQDQVAKLAESPWLVDFDLRKLHPLCCNFGMGNLGMFYGREDGLGNTPEERERRIDRFLAATLAFGHTGFLVLEGGIPNTVRSYFNLQQVHKNYAQESAAEIRYADEQGNLLGTSAAVASGAYRRSQVVTRYSNGLTVAVNGHPTDTWKTPPLELPPNGWCAKGTPELPLTAFSAIVDGHRADYVDSPAYLYADGRGRFTRFEKAACDKQMVAHKRADGMLEVIPVGGCSEFGVSLDGCTAAAVALDADGKELGPAETRLSRGLVYVVPRERAFSYVLKPGPGPAVALNCGREKVVPGEQVQVVGPSERGFQVPPDAASGSRLWQRFDDAWIDFTVVPLVDAELRLRGTFNLKLTPHLPSASAATVALSGQQQQVKFQPEIPLALMFPRPRPRTEEVREVRLEVRAGELAGSRSWWLKAENATIRLAELGAEITAGQRMRGHEEIPLDDASGAQVVWSERTCGDVVKPTLFMHPPYKTGTGYALAAYAPVDLPREPAASLRCEVGKADGSDPGDGILFRVAVVEMDGKETVAAEQPWIQHAWTPLEADLSPWAGRRVQIKLISDVGPEDNSSGDWACWSGMRIESLRPALDVTLHDQPVTLRYEPGPYPVDKIAPNELREARSATLHFQAIGLQSSGQYVSCATLNGIALGTLPSPGGNEAEGIWGDGKIPLSREAIAALALENRLAIRNPGQDSFKVRRMWIEADLADGRRCSSRVSTTVYTQPPEWLYAEGAGVPFGEEIRLEIRF